MVFILPPAYSEQEAIDFLKEVLPNAQVLKIEVDYPKLLVDTGLIAKNKPLETPVKGYSGLKAVVSALNT